MFKSIRAKLFASFSFLALLVLAMSLFSVHQTQKSADDFKTYRSIALNSALASNIQSNMLLMRISVYKYLDTPSDENIQLFNAYFDKTNQLVNEAQSKIKERERLAWINQIRGSLVTYQTVFEKVKTLTEQRDKAMAHTLEGQGLTLEKQLTRLKQMAQANDDTEITYLAAQSLRALLLTQMFSVKYVQSHQDPELTAANRESDLLQQTLDQLKTQGQLPEYSQALEQATSILPSYLQNLQSLFKTVQSRNTFVGKTLNGLGTQMSERSNDIKTAIRSEQDFIGPHVVALNNSTIDGLILLSGIIIVLASGIAYFMPRFIIKGLADIQGKLQAIRDTGDFSIRANDTRQDEIGQMGLAFNQMLKDTQQAISEARLAMQGLAQGEFDQRINIELKGDLLELKTGINDSIATIDHTMQQLSSVIDSLNNGQFEITIETQSQGHFKRMFDRLDDSLIVMNRTFKDINQVMDAMQHGRFDERVAADTRGDLAQLKNSINHSLNALETSFREIITVMVAQSEGDLTQKVTLDVEGELKTLQQAINRSSQQLSSIVSNANTASRIVKEAASEVSLGSSHLSERVQEQAAALEETSATMEQMTVTVQTNANHAREATDVAHEVQAKSVNGSNVMGRTIEAMSAIQESSHKISEIVTLIDGIAFQTNLLALNAAVEAARAGDHGRGFAVVAGEVRSLAQKSAEAAKDIATLINESVERIDQGTQLASESGAVLDTINRSVNDVVTMIEQIAQASEQQMDGIGQIHKAITQIDNVTQQNAALVEETAAAADSLSEQSRSLQDEMAFFTTDEVRSLTDNSPFRALKSTASETTDTRPTLSLESKDARAS